MYIYFFCWNRDGFTFCLLYNFFIISITFFLLCTFLPTTRGGFYSFCYIITSCFLCIFSILLLLLLHGGELLQTVLPLGFLGGVVEAREGVSKLHSTRSHRHSSKTRTIPVDFSVWKNQTRWSVFIFCQVYLQYLVIGFLLQITLNNLNITVLGTFASSSERKITWCLDFVSSFGSSELIFICKELLRKYIDNN